MSSTFMSLETRRVMYRRAAEAADPPKTHRRQLEAGLLDACRRFNDIEYQKMGLLKTGEAHEPHIEIKLARLSMSQALHLEEMCDEHATNLHGHRARALSYALWDSGELAYRVGVGATIEDLMLHAWIRDLTGGS